MFVMLCSIYNLSLHKGEGVLHSRTLSLSLSLPPPLRSISPKFHFISFPPNHSWYGIQSHSLTHSLSHSLLYLLKQQTTKTKKKKKKKKIMPLPFLKILLGTSQIMLMPPSLLITPHLAIWIYLVGMLPSSIPFFQLPPLSIFLFFKIKNTTLLCLSSI
ncbi:hypothetical protein RIF29_16546 [Crotalaria pallida]|uniref:Uncharacterized protein n=1 Tax=Crotalaria pallida TaxID=3830 RepID=A0AAN9FFG5_CROPI